MPRNPMPIIPHTPNQAHLRDHLADRRGELDRSDTLIAQHDTLRLVNTGHGVALQRHDQHFPLTHQELAWLQQQTREDA